MVRLVLVIVMFDLYTLAQLNESVTTCHTKCLTLWRSWKCKCRMRWPNYGYFIFRSCTSL